MKNLFVAFLLMLSLPALAQDRPTLTPQQKLVVAEAVTALVTGPIVLPIAVVTGRREALCHALEGPILSRRSSFNNNSDGKDQCPRGNWLRIIPIIKDHISQE
jgi:hypothetical protein